MAYRTVHTEVNTMAECGTAEAKVQWNSENREYRVRRYENGKLNAACDYFTDDKNDAIGTAACMIN